MGAAGAGQSQEFQGTRIREEADPEARPAIPRVTAGRRDVIGGRRARGAGSGGPLSRCHVRSLPPQESTQCRWFLAPARLQYHELCGL